jgi:hypothetical protein
MSDVQIITIDSSERQMLYDVANKLEGQASVANLPESYWLSMATKLTAIGERPGLACTVVVEQKVDEKKAEAIAAFERGKEEARQKVMMRIHGTLMGDSGQDSGGPS